MAEPRRRRPASVVQPRAAVPGEATRGHSGSERGGAGAGTATRPAREIESILDTEPEPRFTARPRREPPPLVAVTMGDPAGIGPEVVVKAIHGGECLKDCRPVVVGGREIMEEACRRFATHMRVRTIPIEEAPAEFDTSVLYLVDAFGADLKRVVPGAHSSTTGRAAAAAVRLAAKLALGGKVRAVTTAPISKEAFLDLGIAFAGHTEFLASLCEAKRCVPMFVSPRLRVTLVTTHIPLSKVARTVTKTRVVDVIELTQIAMQKFFARRQPRLAVAALNPHCGESGRVGTEESERIQPAIAEARAAGIDVNGPYSGDTVFMRAVNEEFDVVIAMYHDQGLAPVRALGRGKVVNLSLGIPFLRTSVEHGTAPDIAWQGVASEESMVAALRMAGRMASRLDPGRIDWTWKSGGDAGAPRRPR
jgi:4-hydroxythreonine-4-phosphate dehydrogenase